jgi:uncharacterized protein
VIEIWLAFVAGLAGSFHCVGMCGGIVAALAMTRGSQPLSARLGSQLCYNFGRVTTYSILGALAGLLGESLNAVVLKGYFSWFLIGANVFVIAVGLGSALGLGRLNLSVMEGNGARFFAVPLRWAVAGNSIWAAYPLGLMLGLIPCGLVYAPLLSAAVSGGPGKGAATMAALGLGTIPVLLAVGTASSALSGALRSAMLRVAGIAVALMGAAGLWRALARSCCL